MSLPLPATVGDLPEIGTILADAGVVKASQHYQELFASGHRMARAPDGTVLVFANDDLRRLGANPSVIGLPRETNLDLLFRSQLPPDITDEDLGEVRDFFVNVITNLEMPIHEVVKPIFARAVSPKAMLSMSKVMDRVVRKRAILLADKGRFDHLYDFCHLAACDFWAEVLGLTPDEHARILSALPGVGRAVAARLTSRDELVHSNAALRDYFDVLTEAIDRARETEQGGFISEMLIRYDDLRAKGHALPPSLELCIAASLSDGFHTMAMGANNVSVALLSRPEALAQVRRDPALVNAAVAEGLRLYAPLSLFYRFVAEDVHYDGLHLLRGQVLSMLWGAGNLDPGQYERPAEYDLTRKATPLTTFGTGAQLCPGRNLANMMANSVLRLITGPEFEVVFEGDVVWTETPPVNAINIAISTQVSMRRNG